MATEFLDILPDPSYGRDTAGFLDASVGQPFARYQLGSVQPREEDRTISGKVINRRKSYHKWSVDITYNPMLRDDFNSVYLFLMQRRGSLRSFFVSLPQYKLPKDLAFQSNGPITPNATYTAGVTSITLEGVTVGSPSVGDMFNVSDDTDTLHTKAYIVTRVETPSDYIVGSPVAAGEIRIHFTPGLQKDLPIISIIKFNEPLIQVVQTQDTQEYLLNTEDLYSFSLKLKEALY